MKKEELCRRVAVWAARNFKDEEGEECPALDKIADQIIYDLESFVKSKRYRKIMRDAIDAEFSAPPPCSEDQARLKAQKELSQKLFPHADVRNMARLIGFIYTHKRWAKVKPSSRAFIILTVLTARGWVVNSPWAYHYFSDYVHIVLGVDDKLSTNNVNPYWRQNRMKWWGDPRAGQLPRNGAIHLALAAYVGQCIDEVADGLSA